MNLKNKALSYGKVPLDKNGNLNLILRSINEKQL